ncbi:MAG TPA: serine hydrolase domain-containing protein [Pyrinomonadaceae bacterium]
MQRRFKFVNVLVTSLLVAQLGVPCFAFQTGSGALTQQQQRFSDGQLPPPRFADPERARKLAAAFPEIERIFTSYVERRHMPGAVMGIIIDGELAWVKTAGVRDTQGRAPVTPDTVFRIASMSKSFTAMAILKLRDEGKLSLDDPVSNYVSALAGLPYPTKDSPALTIRHLLTHSEGFPEDNPWGDRQLAQTNETMDAWMRAGIPFSTAPGTAYEYSNYGFAILGRVVESAARKPYADYVREQILLPLGMRASAFEEREVAREHVTKGYRWEDNAWKEEPILAHGSFGAMGGLWTSARDLARYVSFLMAAFPARDESERGPVRRSSAREMQQAWRAQPASAFRGTVDAPLQLGVAAYGYGLGASQDCRFAHVVGHGGGLPGYGSLMRWLPEHGVGLIAMSNLTYGGFGAVFNEAIAALHKTGALLPRVAQASPALLSAQKDVTQLITKWDDALASRITADNLLMDETAERRAARLKELSAKHGACRPATSIDAENALRGRWRMTCERGWLDVFITLAPTSQPRVQLIGVQSTFPPSEEVTKAVESVMRLMSAWDQKTAESLAGTGFDVERMRKQIGAASQWGACKVGETLAGDGKRDTLVRLNCDRGKLGLDIALDPAGKRLTGFNLLTSRVDRCVP